MAIESVSTATFAPPLARTEQTMQATQAEQTLQAAPAEQSRQAREARQVGGAGRDNEAANTSPPQPVVNAQGQVTGKIINAIA